MASLPDNNSSVYIHRAPIVDAGKIVDGQIHHYTRMANTFWDRRDMKPEEKGILGQLLSKGDSWRWNPQYLIATNDSGGNRIYKILNRLIKLGYLHRAVTRDNQGRCTETVYHVYEFPELNPYVECPLSGNQQVGNARYNNNQDTALTNNQSEEQSTNRPSEPARQDAAPQADRAVGFSLTVEGGKGDPAVEPTGWAIVDSLRQIATEKGIEPKQPTKDLAARLTTSPMTTQGEVLAATRNYPHQIKNFWGLVNYLLNNPDKRKEYAALAGAVAGQDNGTGGDSYQTEDQWTEEETAPVAQIHTGHDDDGFDELRRRLFQRRDDWNLGTLKLQDVRLISRDTDHYVVGVMAYAGTVEQLNVREAYQKRLSKILEDVGVMYHDGRIPSVHFECDLSRSNFISAHPITQARAHAMVGDD